MGMISYFSSKFIGQASEELKRQRLGICQECNAINSFGDRIYRFIDNKQFCGEPFKLTDILRNEKLEGCGCNLEIKTSKEKSECPLGKW